MIILQNVKNIRRKKTRKKRLEDMVANAAEEVKYIMKTKKEAQKVEKK